MDTSVEAAGMGRRRRRPAAYGSCVLAFGAQASRSRVHAPRIGRYRNGRVRPSKRAPGSLSIRISNNCGAQVVRSAGLLSHYLAGATGPKFAASLGLPLPLYFAYNGYG